MKTVNIKGKEYVMVNERILEFKKLYPGWNIETEIIEVTDSRVIMKAIIKDELARIVSTGHAFEYADSSFINKTSFIENCETSAVGRALGFCGIGIENSIATAEEVQTAIKNQPHELHNDESEQTYIDAIKKKLDTIKTKDQFLGLSNDHEFVEQMKYMQKKFPDTYKELRKITDTMKAIYGVEK